MGKGQMFVMVLLATFFLLVGGACGGTQPPSPPKPTLQLIAIIVLDEQGNPREFENPSWTWDVQPGVGRKDERSKKYTGAIVSQAVPFVEDDPTKLTMVSFFTCKELKTFFSTPRGDPFLPLDAGVATATGPVTATGAATAEQIRSGGGTIAARNEFYKQLKLKPNELSENDPIKKIAIAVIALKCDETVTPAKAVEVKLAPARWTETDKKTK